MLKQVLMDAWTDKADSVFSALVSQFKLLSISNSKYQKNNYKKCMLLLCMIVWHAINNITMCVMTFALLGIVDPGK